MWVYVLIFIIAVALYLISNEDNERSKLVLGIYLGGLALFVGCADMLGGYDRYIYGEVFDQLALIERNDGDLLASAGYRLFATEWGYLWYNRLLGYVTLNRYVFIFITTCVIYTLLFISIKRYCSNYPFAVIVFLGLWFFFTFTYLRQVMAATIGWLAIQYAIDRKPIPYFLIVFIAFTFHNSAIVLAPFYFVPIKKFNRQVVIWGLIAAFVFGLGNLLGGLVAESDAFVDAARAEQNATLIAEGSFRPEYFLEALLFAGLILWNYDSFDEDDKKQIVLMNMSLVFCAILLVFIRSDNGGRIAWHYMIGVIATLSVFGSKSQYALFFRHAIILIFCALFIRVLTAWGNNGFLILYPYKTMFTNGFREGDRTHEIYEYDVNYDYDKFYK